MYNVKHFISFASFTFFFLQSYNSIHYATRQQLEESHFMTKTRHKDSAITFYTTSYSERPQHHHKLHIIHD